MTIYDIAEKAGVSASTVSRVINHKPGISAKTRQKVQRIIEECGFSPDASARSLVTQNSQFIGILIEDLRVPGHAEAAFEIEQEMSRNGYTSMTFSTGGSLEEKERYFQILQNRKVDGCVLVGSMFSTEPVQAMIKKYLPEVPVIIINGTLDVPNSYSLLVDEERGIQDCVKYLKSRGKTRLAFIMDTPTPANERKKSGYFIGLFCNDLLKNKERIVCAEGSGAPQESITRGKEAARQLLEQYPDTDGIICATDSLAIGCMEALKEQGLQIPGDIAVMGVDNALLGQIYTPSLSTLDNKLPELAASAAKMLLNVLDHQEVPQKMMLFTDILSRGSA